MLSWLVFFSPGLLHGQRDRFHDVCAQSLNPLERHLNEPIVAYRLTVPTIAWGFHLGGIGVLLIQYLAVVGALACVYAAVARRTADRRIGLLAALAVGFTFVAQWSNNYLGFTESVSHFCAGLCLLFPNPAAVVALTLAGTVNDERFVLTIPFLVLWHGGLTSLRTMLASGWRLAISFALGLTLAWLIRRALTVGWIGPGLQLPPLYDQMRQEAIARLRPWDSTWGWFALNVFMALRWVWVFPLWFLLARRNRESVGLGVRILFCVCLVAGTMSAMLVADVSKSVAFVFPAALLGMVGMVQAERARAYRWLLIVVLLLLVTPTFFSIGYWSERLRPMPLELAREYLRSR